VAVASKKMNVSLQRSPAHDQAKVKFSRQRITNNYYMV